MRPIDADALLNDPYFLTVRRVDEFDEIGESVSYLAVPVEYIEKAPTIDYAPVVHGEWIHDINNLYACSECLMRQTQRMRGRLMNFCPNCGASMMDGGKSNG